MIRKPIADEAIEKINKSFDQILESMGGTLAQLKHARYHLKENMPAEIQAELEKHIASTEAAMKSIGELSVSFAKLIRG